MAHTERRTLAVVASVGLTLALATGALAARGMSDDEEALAASKGLAARGRVHGLRFPGG